MPSTDTRRLFFHCPACRAEMSQVAAWLKSHQEIICPSCNATVRIDASDLAAGKVKVLGADKAAGA